MVSPPILPRPKKYFFRAWSGFAFANPVFLSLLSYPEHFFVFFKLILIKESISLNVFIKKTFTISDLASLAVPSYVLRLPLYNRPFPGRQASEVHRSLENLLGRLFLNLWRLRSLLSFITGIYLSIISGTNPISMGNTQTPPATVVEYPFSVQGSCERFLRTFFKRVP